ncbi:PREDICTED: ATPase ASNA1 homolog [Ipomoea nil]|uniref:ATPase ASNA1 homolog n=1 Tax=Ipomoea nil TaxID=35883 RepID=UPI000901C4B8|nr:PREDICTED: ATPase ASNA1 homolog [Ipomoea nil]XP_019188949.1 PREDICTED: ATPase ASNA1 homolog [Ipomoea nil]
MASLFHYISKSQRVCISLFRLPTSFISSFSAPSFNSYPSTFTRPFQVAYIASLAETATGFDDMVSGTKRKYFMLGGKGGVGKTSCAASLAVKFANHGHPTIVVSTDPAHSLSHSFDQDLTGGTLVPVQGVDSPLYALEINPDKTREEFRAVNQDDGVKDFMNSMGVGTLAEQLGDLKFTELLDTLPPGVDEVVAISKVIQFVESKEYSNFTRIVFDTAPTGHTLWLLSLPEVMDASIGKMMKLKKKIASANSAIKSVFGKESPRQDDTNDTLQQLRSRMAEVRDLFHDTEATEFIIVTIPSAMAVSESSRLCKFLKKEKVAVRRLVVNQVLSPSASNCKLCDMRRKDQSRVLDLIGKDPDLGRLMLLQAPLFDAEIRGAPALKFMGDTVWK